MWISCFCIIIVLHKIKKASHHPSIEQMNITTKEQFINLCMNTDVPKDVWDTFDGMDFVIYMNEFRRIVEGLELTSVKTYSWRLTAPRLYNHNIGYFED